RVNAGIHNVKIAVTSGFMSFFSDNKLKASEQFYRFSPLFALLLEFLFYLSKKFVIRRASSELILF
ncbi:hypothetical protein, partial [Vibrio parahaemolyticus]|uniref:hypothetical protein n=1 Tax=Vibrio parahaemolyticus TaxID=670 RepID=UPI0015DFDD0B